jgi:hypothetical protein
VSERGDSPVLLPSSAGLYTKQQQQKKKREKWKNLTKTAWASSYNG